MSTVFATTPEARAVELANLARWETEQVTVQAEIHLDLALRGARRWALSRSVMPVQHEIDRAWHRDLVKAALSQYVGDLAAVGVA